METDFPDGVEKFVDQHIASVEQLEIFLRLFKSRERTWTAAELNREIRSRESSISRWLEVLVKLKLATVEEGQYRYAPVSAELDRQTASLSECYHLRPLRVIEFIFSKPKNSLLNFAQAFVFRKQP